jgi:phosphatidylserine decarboxylase
MIYLLFKFFFPFVEKNELKRKEKKKRMIAITAPHAYCAPNDEEGHHWCDFLATKAAERLANAFSGSSKIFQTSINREECDLNRPTCQPTSFSKEGGDKAQKWHQEIFDWINENKSKWLLDIHSFPPHSGSFDNGDHEVVLLFHLPLRASTQEFVQFLKKRGVDIQMIQGSQTGYASNAIVNEALENCPSLVDALLLEFREDLSTQRLDEISNIISQLLFQTSSSSIRRTQTNSSTQFYSSAVVHSMAKELVFLLQKEPQKEEEEDEKSVIEGILSVKGKQLLVSNESLKAQKGLMEKFQRTFPDILVGPLPQVNEHVYLSIVSPTSGQVQHIATDKKGRVTVEIYLKPTDKHDIYAPANATIHHILAHQGQFQRYNHLFKAFENKTGRLIITFLTEHGKEEMSLWVEVGKGYITDTVKFEGKEHQEVIKGQKLGEIVIGSFAQITLPASFSLKNIRVKIGDTLIGGQTLLV